MGSTSLFLQTTYARGTKDSDVVETGDLAPMVRDRLLQIAGKGTATARRHGLYLEFVAQGILFLPETPR